MVHFLASGIWASAQDVTGWVSFGSRCDVVRVAHVSASACVDDDGSLDLGAYLV